MEHTTVIGGGAWGTALAVHLGRRDHAVRLWMRETELVERIRTHRDNPAYLPGIRIPDTVIATTDMRQALEGATRVLSAVPAQFARGVYRQIRPLLGSGTPLVVTAKGIEEGSLQLPLDVLHQELGDVPSAVLSGPSFAPEVARGLPTAVVIAACDEELGRSLQRSISSREFRLYTHTDTVGVQIAAALKNVIAIAVGIADSLEMGSNARAGLITRGLAQISRLGIALGGSPGTLSGLAGLGDLVLTCTGELSRNRRVGIRLGRGERLQDILSRSRSVAEGVCTARSARQLASKTGVEMPIVDEVCRILFEGASAHDGLDRLLSRPLTSEEIFEKS